MLLMSFVETATYFKTILSETNSRQIQFLFQNIQAQVLLTNHLITEYWQSINKNIVHLCKREFWIIGMEALNKTHSCIARIFHARRWIFAHIQRVFPWFLVFVWQKCIKLLLSWFYQDFILLHLFKWSKRLKWCCGPNNQKMYQRDSMITHHSHHF